MTSKDDEKDDEDGYIGNLWGWKMSRWSLALLIFVICLMFARKYYVEQETGKKIDLWEWEAQK